jgi:hypothetical protein
MGRKRTDDTGEPWPTPEVIPPAPAPVSGQKVITRVMNLPSPIPLQAGIPLPDQNSPTWRFVLAFACAMEYKLSQNHYKGDLAGWRKAGPRKLQDSLDHEVEELNAALWDAVEPNKRDVLLEAADVGNFAMMIADSVQHS